MTTAKRTMDMVQRAIEDGREVGPSITIDGDTVTICAHGHADTCTVTDRTTNFYGEPLWSLSGPQYDSIVFAREGHITAHGGGRVLCRIESANQHRA